MAQAEAEPRLISVTEDEQAVLSKIEQFIEHAVIADDIPPKLIDPAGNTVELPASVFHLMQATVHHLAQGQAVVLVPVDKELTTQQAAELLNVSRPYLVKLLEHGNIPYTKTGTHRRIRLTDLQTYKVQRDMQRAELLTQLTQLSQEIGLYNG